MSTSLVLFPPRFKPEEIVTWTDEAVTRLREDDYEALLVIECDVLRVMRIESDDSVIVHTSKGHLIQANVCELRPMPLA